MALAAEIFLDNDFVFSLGPVTTKVRTTSSPAILSGATVRGYIAATSARTASPINAALDFTLVEDGTTGVYHGAVDGSLITTHLAAFIDTPVWFHFTVNGTDYRSRESTTVRAERTP